ncbi:MAG: phytanoyl-CoA dioxygenase family protein [Rhodoferax sp.]|nr:phytanoyl-CoA dioxygenase family protein [Rhodoferax sp.]
MHETAFIAGKAVPPSQLGRLNEISDWRSQPDALPQCLARDGYVLLRNALGRDQVMAARLDVLERLAAVGEIAEPLAAAVASGNSRRAELHPDLNAFWRGVCEAPRLRAVTHAGALADISAALLGGTTKPFDFLWLRTMLEGRASPLHFDHVYMNRGSRHLLTAWVPLGDVPTVAGPLVVVEGSNRFEDLQARYRGVDVDRDGLPGSFPEDAVAFAASRNARLLTADFNAGDVILFDMFTLHGSCDNRMGGGRVRLSCDVRWQLAAEPGDDRWFGAPPTGHGGHSYGGLNGARPLGEAYIAR